MNVTIENVLELCMQLGVLTETEDRKTAMAELIDRINTYADAEAFLCDYTAALAKSIMMAASNETGELVRGFGKHITAEIKDASGKPITRRAHVMIFPEKHAIFIGEGKCQTSTQPS